MMYQMLICAACLLAVCEIALSSLQVNPFMLAVNPGQDVQFTCNNPDNETKTIYLRWSAASSSHENSTFIPTSGRIWAANGTLTISNTTYGDAKTYTCSDETSSDTETGILKVYEMPDYLTEGLIIAGICLGLILALVVGMCLTMKKQRQQRKGRLMEAEKKHPKKRQNHRLNSNQ